jgi:hypothetical protein
MVWIFAKKASLFYDVDTIFRIYRETSIIVREKRRKWHEFGENYIMGIIIRHSLTEILL